MSEEKKIVRNPLAVAFGVFLEKRRNNKSTDLIAQHLSITSSFYRMMEAGKATLNSTRSLSLLEMDSFDDIRFEQLSRLFVILSITDQCESIFNYKLTIERLLTYDEFHDITLLFEKFNLLFQNYELENLRGDVISCNLDKNINKFLTKSPISKFIPIIQRKATQMSRASGMFLEPIFDIIENWECTPHNISMLESSKWEEKNKYKFQQLSAVSLESESILNSGNFDSFKYDYLLLDSFTSAKFLFLDKKADSKVLTEKFKSLLLESLGEDKKKKEKMGLAFDQKVVVRCVGQITKESIENLMVHKDEEIESFWIYEFTNHHLAGFLRKPSEKEFFNGMTMPLEDTYDKKETFNDVFNELS